MARVTVTGNRFNYFQSFRRSLHAGCQKIGRVNATIDRFDKAWSADFTAMARSLFSSTEGLRSN